MDDIVKQAMAKWPTVPHCYGWLALDARGQWRMRDERAQALQLPGERIRNAALQNFINRNYTHDEQGRWYFQNGPQRVYVNLEVAPYVAHTDPAHGFSLHTGEALNTLDAAWMTVEGLLLLQAGKIVALVDDRDMAQCLGWLRIDGATANDEQLLQWLEEGNSASTLRLEYRGQCIPVHRIARETIASRFGFEPAPRP